MTQRIDITQKPVFLEVGASDFDTLLPLARRGWRGVILEPIPKHAETLRATVKEEGLDVMVIEAAITTHNGKAKMYECLEGDEQWTRGISHMVNQSGTKLLELKANEHLRKQIVTVDCFRLDTLLWDVLSFQYLPQPIDFMKVDIEGHEADVLKDYSWNLRPKSMKIEHKHCDDQNMKRLLEDKGYIVWRETDDLYAIR